MNLNFIFEKFVFSFLRCLVFTFAIHFAVASVVSHSSVSVIYSSDAIRFSSHKTDDSPLIVSQLADIVRVATGQTATNSIGWKGIEIAKVFELPRMSLIVRIADIELGAKVAKEFDKRQQLAALIETNTFNEQFQSLANSLSQKFEAPIIANLDLISEQNKITFNDNSLQHNFDTFSGSQSSQLLPNALQKHLTDREEIRRLREEIVSIKATIETIRYAKQMRTQTNSVDNNWPPMTTIWVEMGAKRTDFDDNESEINSEIVNVRRQLIREFVSEMRELFDNKIVAILVADGNGQQVDNDNDNEAMEQLKRIRRNVIREDGNSDNRSLGLAHEFDSSFAPAFAMITFTVALIAVTSFALAVAMWNVDPGRDSIIYRMTAQRVKKEQ